MDILVSSLSAAPRLMQERRPSRVLSLLDPLTKFPDASAHGIDAHLRISIHDIADPEHGCILADAAHMGEIVRFVSDWDRTAPILIHCWAGVSRSTASAFITACVHHPAVDEEDIAWALRRASPTATPNPRLVALADAELGRGGRMSRAAAAIGRGTPSWEDIIEAEPFELIVGGAERP